MTYRLIRSVLLIALLAGLFWGGIRNGIFSTGRQRGITALQPSVEKLVSGLQPASNRYRLNDNRVWVNGVPAVMNYYVTSRPPHVILDDFQMKWHQPGTLVLRNGGYDRGAVVAYDSLHQVLRTVLAADEGDGAKTLVVVSEKQIALARGVRSIRGMPDPPGAAPLMQMEGALAGGPSVTRIILSRDSPATVARHYQNRMADHGWRSVTTPKAFQRAPGTRVLFFEKSGEECTVTITATESGQGSLALVNVSSRGH